MGRPRKFDCDAVLEGAVDLFRERGFDGVSLPDITETLGICRQSLYTNFGDKRGLYLKALERYGQREVDAKLSVLEREGSALDNIRTTLAGFAAYASDCPNDGCLTVTALVESRHDSGALTAVEQQVSRLEEGFREALERARAAGELKQDSQPQQLARAFLTTIQGIGLVCRLPGSEERIRDAVAVSLQLLDAART